MPVCQRIAVRSTKRGPWGRKYGSFCGAESFFLPGEVIFEIVRSRFASSAILESRINGQELATIAGVEISDGDVSNIINSVTSFERWMTDRFSATAVHRELPLLGIDDNGSVVSGTADLVLETDGGIWIIDHKSDQVDEPELAFNSYRPQLECYATLLRSMGHNVLGMGINWIRRGEVNLTAHSYG